jgi:hypothetical protein
MKSKFVVSATSLAVVWAVTTAQPGRRLFFHHFLGNLRGVDSAGFYSASLASPLPPTWTMMLIGLACFGFILYRRNGRDSIARVVPT